MIRTRLSPCRAKRGALPIQTVTVDLSLSTLSAIPAVSALEIRELPELGSCELEVGGNWELGVGD
jgi:hypothetical protein